jgi:hypothetical protein
MGLCTREVAGLPNRMREQLSVELPRGKEVALYRGYAGLSRASNSLALIELSRTFLQKGSGLPDLSMVTVVASDHEVTRRGK